MLEVRLPQSLVACVLEDAAAAAALLIPLEDLALSLLPMHHSTGWALPSPLDLCPALTLYSKV